jgi:hypothetical protein
MKRSGEDASGQLDTVKIRPFHRDDLDEVIRLWSLCRLTVPGMILRKTLRVNFMLIPNGFSLQR